MCAATLNCVVRELNHLNALTGPAYTSLSTMFLFGTLYKSTNGAPNEAELDLTNTSMIIGGAICSIMFMVMLCKAMQYE